MIVSEGTVYGIPYHTVTPVTPTINKWDEMEDWCINTFGKIPTIGVWVPNCRWYMNDSKFWFKNKKDLEWFILRWI